MYPAETCSVSRWIIPGDVSARRPLSIWCRPDFPLSQSLHSVAKWCKDTPQNGNTTAAVRLRWRVGRRVKYRFADSAAENCCRMWHVFVRPTLCPIITSGRPLSFRHGRSGVLLPWPGAAAPGTIPRQTVPSRAPNVMAVACPSHRPCRG